MMKALPPLIAGLIVVVLWTLAVWSFAEWVASSGGVMG